MSVLVLPDTPIFSHRRGFFCALFFSNAQHPFFKQQNVDFTYDTNSVDQAGAGAQCQKSQDKCGLFQYSNAPLLFQFYKVLAGFIKNDGKQMSQVVRKYFGWRYAPVFTKAFQFRPDLLAGQFFSAFATKDGAGGSFPIFVTFEQLAAQLTERRITRILPFTHDGVRVLFI